MFHIYRTAVGYTFGRRGNAIVVTTAATNGGKENPYAVNVVKPSAFESNGKELSNFFLFRS